MRSLTKETIPEFPRSDVELSGIDWLPDCGLRFTLLLGDNRKACLTCSWITKLRMDLDFGKNSGKAMTSDIEYSEPDAGWHVVMDFANAGSIEFGCEAVALEYLADC